MTVDLARLTDGQFVHILAAMATNSLSDKEIISLLGGPGALKDVLPYTAHAIAGWMKANRGIPWKARSQVAKLAAAKRVKLPSGFLEERVELSAPSKRRAAA